MATHVVVLGAGFGGLELSTMLSEAGGFDVTLIDKNDAFIFGFSKLDVMFGRATPDAVRLAYRDIAMPGVQVLQETVTAIDPETRQWTPERAFPGPACPSSPPAPNTPGTPPRLSASVEASSTLAGAPTLAQGPPRISRSPTVFGACGAPRSSPPAPRANALLLADNSPRAACAPRAPSLASPPSPHPRPPHLTHALRSQRGLAAREPLIPGRRVTAPAPPQKIAGLSATAALPLALSLLDPAAPIPLIIISRAVTPSTSTPPGTPPLKTRATRASTLWGISPAGVPQRGCRRRSRTAHRPE